MMIAFWGWREAGVSALLASEGGGNGGGDAGD